MAITAYFNPGRSRRRAFNYRVFRDRLTVPLVTVELADEGAFELAEGDADRLVRVSGGDLIWQKERLLNIALAHLPADCTHVVWLDSDIVFLSDDWPDRLLDALRRWRLVQPFARAFQVAPGWEEGMPLGEHVVAPSPGAAAVIKAHGLDAYVDLVRDGGTLQPVVGYGWAARRDLLDAHGFFDACIIGGGDRAIFSAGQGIFESVMDVHHMNAGQRRRFLAWAEPFHADVRGEVGYIAGDVAHLWHGDLKRRLYRQRHVDLAPLGFDPSADIALTDAGLWRWSSDRPALHDHVRRYFEFRDGCEDSPAS
ncbi:MAG: hypothetical protein KDK07_16810 [Bauldia sp.]|nr:hypothetical protein [Bauldia sp.]